MYWSRTGSPFELIAWMFLCGLWWTGGWLLCAHAFRLRSRERLFNGGASGMLLFIVFSNLLGRLVPLVFAYWGAGLLVLGLGSFAAWRSTMRPRLPIRDLFVWPQIFAFLGLLLFYALVNRGMAIFDDFANLPLVSMIATGDLPPHFHLNPDITLDYHYGLHLLAASLVRIGGFHVWSAFDLSKALVTAFTPILAWLWLRRYFQQNLALFFGVLLILFAAGSRWLLLWFPEDALLEMSSGLQMIGSAARTGPDLYTALINPWKIEGGGPIPFPFAFVNGMFPPLLPMSSIGALSRMSVILLLCLARRRWRPLPGLVYGLLLAALALAVEHIFLIAWAGILLAVLVRLWRQRPSREALEWGWVLVPSAALALVMGGVITQSASRWLALLSSRSSHAGIGLAEITLNWPPTFLSAHLGSLSLTDPGQILIALAEMGPVLFLAPWMTWLSGKYLRSGNLVMAGLSLMAAAAFLVPLFLRFTERSRDLTRLTEAALYIWLVLGIPYVWLAARKGNQMVRFVVAASFVITTLSGIALLPAQMIAIARPQPSYFVQEPDALLSRVYWDQLEEDAQILDITYPYRPATLFGRSAGRAYRNIYTPLPEFKALLEDLDPVQMAEAGYTYFYLDRDTWQKMPAEMRQALKRACVKLVAEQKTALGDFRRLYKIEACR